MNVSFKPFVPSGTVKAPPSKSDVHRAIICAALSGGKCTISPVALSEDIKATIRCVESLGAVTNIDKEVLTVDGSRMFENKEAQLDCSESGSTLRFMIPVAAAGGVTATFTGKGRLPERPIGIYAEALPKACVEFSCDSGLPLTISGQLKGGVFKIPGDISSQFISGLLFALPLLKRDSDIVLTSPIQSVGYINMTIRTMEQFGIEVDATDTGWHVRGQQHYIPSDYTTDGDWSQAAFYMVSGAIGGEITVDGVNTNSAQGDRKIAELLREFGAEVIQDASSVTVKKSALSAIEIDAKNIPDLVPVLAVCAAFARGTTKIINAERLRIKESDRLKTTAELLKSLGAKVTEQSGGLEIEGIRQLDGGSVNGYNDHRIVMSAAVCAACCKGEITCTDALSINKSYPDFYRDYNSVGGKAELRE